MAVRISDGVETMLVSAQGQGEVRTPTEQSEAGFVQISCESDDGTVLTNRKLIAPEASEDYRLRVGMDQTMMNMSFEGTIIATDRIQQAVSVMTIAQASGFLTLNSAGVFGSTNHANWRTYRTFPVFGSYPLYGEMWIRETGPTAGVAISEWGFGYAATTAVPTDGVFFRRIAGGQLQAIVCFAGVETPANITTTNVPPRDGSGTYDATEVSRYAIVVSADSAEFWINDTLVASIPCPSNQGTMARSSAQPIFARVYYASAGAAARTLDIGQLNVSLGDMNAGKPWPHVVAGLGGSAYSVQPGTAAGPTITRASGATGWPASATARIAGTWTATSAPALSNLGGLFTTPAYSTLTADADYPVFAWLNPAGTNAIPGKTLYITGLRCGEAYAATAAATAASFWSCIASAGATAAATTTGDAATTVGLRPVVLGGYGFGASDAAGTTKQGFDVQFNTPLVVPPGTYFHFIIRPTGVVTTNTLTIHSSLMVNGYFE